MDDTWDAYMLRYGGYYVETLQGFVEQGIATYDAVADAYTVQCGRHYGHDPASCSGTFTVTNEFA